MGRTLDEVLASLSAERPTEVEDRDESQRLRAEAVAELSRIVGAAAAAVDAPGGAGLAERAARFLLALRSAVEAAGGSFRASVELPGRPLLDLSDLADAASREDPATADPASPPAG